MRKHTLEATGGKTYADLPRFVDEQGKPTQDESAAAKDPKSGPGLLRRERRYVRTGHRVRPAAHRYRLPRPDNPLPARTAARGHL
jgi:hypothetical protein